VLRGLGEGRPHRLEKVFWNKRGQHMTDTVNAAPTKRLFIEMLTRDVSLEDAVLDLIDNAIDSVCRRKDIDLSARAQLRQKTRSRYPWPT